MRQKIIKIFKIICLTVLVIFIAMIGDGLVNLMSEESKETAEEIPPFEMTALSSVDTARYSYSPQKLIQNDGMFEITGRLNLEDGLKAIADTAGQTGLLFEEQQENSAHETVFKGRDGVFYCYEETVEKNVNTLLRSAVNKYFGNSTPATLSWEYFTLKENGMITISCENIGTFNYERSYDDSIYRCDWTDFESAEEIRALFQELFPSFLQNDEKRMTSNADAESFEYEVGERWIHIHMELSTDNVTKGVYDGVLISSKDRSEKAAKLFNMIDKSSASARKSAPKLSLY